MQREMARNLILRSFVFRHVTESRIYPLYNHLHSDSFGTLISTSTTVDPSPPSNSFTNTHLSNTITSRQLSFLPQFRHFRSFSSDPGPSNIVLVKSEEEFNNILSKVQDQPLPAIFYFTAVWCGPCRFISPVIGELSEKYPHVTTYKIDIDEEAIQGMLGKLQITSVPTLHFFQNGKKADELIGADVARLKYIIDKLYNKD